jgi:hypothetical protein
MFRKDYPRIYELRDLQPDGYFSDLDSKLQDSTSAKHLRFVEDALMSLDSQSWGIFKAKIHRYLQCPHKIRKWQQLFDHLNEAKAYYRLKSRGCSNLALIPESDIKTPDILGKLADKSLLCEVKSINISDSEADLRLYGQYLHSPPLQLNDAFFNKLRLTIKGAQGKLEEYDPDNACIHIAFIVLRFDDFWGENNDVYITQIDSYLSHISFEKTELRFLVIRTPFDKCVPMKSAQVDYE